MQQLPVKKARQLQALDSAKETQKPSHGQCIALRDPQRRLAAIQLAQSR